MWQPEAHFNSDRRHAPRHEAQLELRLLYRAVAHAPGDARPQAEMSGHTRNLSETGLALAVPDIRVGEQFLNVVGTTLRLLLSLPTGKVLVHATPVWCERLNGNGPEEGYVVGVRITKMDDREWVRYVQYLRSLR